MHKTNKQLENVLERKKRVPFTITKETIGINFVGNMCDLYEEIIKFI